MANEHDSNLFRDEQATFRPSDQGMLDFSRHTALLVIDPVNDFLSEGAPPGTSPRAPSRRTM